MKKLGLELMIPNAGSGSAPDSSARESAPKRPGTLVILTLLIASISALWLAPAASAGTVTITGSMEGNLAVNPGDTVKAGYDFTMPDQPHKAATVSVSGTVVLSVKCPNNSSQSITINLPFQTYSVPANSNSWFPSANQNSPSVYQGQTTASTCPGGHAPSATFTANVMSTDNCDTVNIRFHYSDNSPGSWSATATAISPSKCVSPPCCKCQNQQGHNNCQ